MTFLDWSILAGGLAVFLHGLELAREGLQTLAGERLRTILFALSGNRVVAFLSGALVTGVIQSSTATTVMLVGFAGSGLMTLAQAMAVLLGADIGTTVTVQLITFRLSTWALAVVAGGFGIRFFSKKRRNRFLGETVMGFGLLFLGMKLMADATLPLRHSPAFAEVLAYLGASHFTGLAGAALATVLMQGSAPTIGLVIAMSASGTMTLSAALPMVLGANIGTTFTPFLAASKAPAEGKRVAFAHAAFKVVGVLVFLPLLEPFASLLQATSGDVSRQIANGHTLFNVVTALAFLPFVGLGAMAVRRFYRPSEEQERFGPRYLDPRAIESPALALGNAQREFLRMADIVRDMVKDSIRCFEGDGLDLAADIEGRDDKVDILNREIRFYLAKLAQAAITREQAERQMDLISLAADLENVGDLVNKNVLAMARKKLAHGLAFSRDGWTEILSFHGMVCENFDLALVAFTTGDEELARKVLRHRVKLVEIETELKEKHIARLNQGLRESLETSSMHLDLLAYYRSINGYIGNLGTTVVSSHEQQEGQRE